MIRLQTFTGTYKDFPDYIFSEDTTIVDSSKVTISGVDYQLPSKQLRVPLKYTVIANGTIAEGFRSVTFITSDDFSGTINGDISSASTSYSYSDTDCLNEINYEIITGSIEIMEIR